MEINARISYDRRTTLLQINSWLVFLSTMIEQFKDFPSNGNSYNSTSSVRLTCARRWKFLSPNPLCKAVQPPKKRENKNDTEEKLASVQHTLVILSLPLLRLCAPTRRSPTRNSTKPPPRARMQARVEIRGCVQVSTGTMRSWPYCGERLVGQGWPEIKR